MEKVTTHTGKTCVVTKGVKGSLDETVCVLQARTINGRKEGRNFNGILHKTVCVLSENIERKMLFETEGFTKELWIKRCWCEVRAYKGKTCFVTEGLERNSG